MTEECLGQAQVPPVQTVAQGSEADIQSLSDDLYEYARHNFSNTVVVNMQVTKESAKKFKENSFAASRSSISFHLHSVEAKFVSWKRTDPRVSKEVFKCKILPSAISSCFSIQRTKSDARLSQRMIIPFSSILGLEVSDDSVVMDVTEIPTMERKIFSSTQHHKTTGQASDTSKGKWTGEIISNEAVSSPPYRVYVTKHSVNDPAAIQLKEVFGKIPSLKEASAIGLCDVYPRTSSCVENNPEERYPVVKDPTLVRAAQLACLRLLHCLPEHDRTEFVVRMYSSLEDRFNSLLKTRIQHLGN